MDIHDIPRRILEAAHLTKSSDQSEDEASSWKTLEFLRKMGSDSVDLKFWLAAVDDTLHAVLPANSKLLEQFVTLEKEPLSEDCKQKTLAFIDMTQRILVLNRPASSGLEQEIRDLITKQFVKSLPFWFVIVLSLSLCGALFGVDWYYAGKAREIVANMQKQLDGARAAIFESTSDLNKITTKAQTDLNSIVAKAQGDLAYAASQAENSVGTNGKEASEAIAQAGRTGSEAIERAGRTGEENINKEWSGKVEQLRKQALEVKQVPLTGWLFGGGYGVLLLSGILSFLALVGAFVNHHAIHAIRRSAASATSRPAA